MLSYLAPAKINLTLEVLARREDGYHALRSVMVPLSLADAIAIEPSERFAFECGAEGLGGNDNLVVRAAAALGAPPPVRITLMKHIPSQAGLLFQGPAVNQSTKATILLHPSHKKY